MTLQQQNWPFRYRVLFYSLILSLLACLIVALPISRAAVHQLEQQAIQLRNTLSKQASVQASDAIFSQDLLSLNVILSTLVAHPHIRYAAVYDLDNRVIAEQGEANDDTGQPLSIQYQNEVIGLLEVRIDEAPLQHSVQRIYSLLAVLSLLFAIVASTVGWLIGKNLGQKIDRSSQDIKDLECADEAVHTHTWGELSLLSNHIKDFKQKQSSSLAMHHALNHFMTPNVNNDQSLNYQQPQLPDTYAHAAILFIDFVDFQQVQKNMLPKELAALLNQYYFFIHQAARLYNGNVDKYVGDGVMVLFGIPQQDEKDCFHGACTALLIIGLIKLFNKQRHQQALPVIEFQLGLHTGNILAGTFGDKDTLTYTAIGDAIHVAARLCRKSQENRLLISKQVVDQGRLGGQLILNAHKSIQGSQPQQAIETYWAEHLTSNYQALIERQIEHISALQANETS